MSMPDEDIPADLTDLAHLLLWVAEMAEAGRTLDDEDIAVLKAWSAWTAQLADELED